MRGVAQWDEGRCTVGQGEVHSGMRDLLPCNTVVSRL